MEVNKTTIQGLLIFRPKVFRDNRGYFLEVFNQKIFNNILPNINFIQDNESKAKFGVLRGLHYQKPPYDQSKLVRVVYGKVQDVVVDLRKESPTYGNYQSFILSSKNKNQLFIPKGCAHGFLTLSDNAIFNYKIDNPYSPDHELGIRYDDETLKIKWALSKNKIILSGKDQNLDNFNFKNYK